MNPQPSPSQPNAEYEMEPDPTVSSELVPQGNRSEMPPAEVSSILREVLGETLVRSRESAADLLQALTAFRQRSSHGSLCESHLPDLVRVVLRHRLGSSYAKLPDDLFEEVGRSLWTHEHSRARVERLWQALRGEA